MSEATSPYVPPLQERINQKLSEAEFFLEHMRRLENVHTTTVNAHLDHFRFYTSAFLNAVRSPQQYILEEWSIIDPHTGKKSFKPAQKRWYDSTVSTLPILRFITTERDSNIHNMQTRPMAFVRITVDEGSQTDSTTFHQEWLNYTGKDKTVTGVAQAALDTVRELISQGISLGHIL